MGFLELVAERYGNKNAKWCEGRLSAKQQVKALHPFGEDRFIDCIATGKKKRGEHVLRCVVNGRKWTITRKSRDVLVFW